MGRKKKLTTQAHLMVDGEMFSSPVFPANTREELHEALTQSEEWYEMVTNAYGTDEEIRKFREAKEKRLERKQARLERAEEAPGDHGPGSTGDD